MRFRRQSSRSVPAPTTPTETGEITDRLGTWSRRAGGQTRGYLASFRKARAIDDNRGRGLRTALRLRLNGAYGTLRTRGVVDLAKANRRGPKRGARAEGHGQVETCKHRGPNRRDRRHRDPRSTQTRGPKRAAISRARRRTLNGSRLRHVESGAFDGARPRGRRIADH